LFVVAGFAAAEMENVALFDSYTKAYRTAQQTERPLLVVLNPSQESGKEGVSLGDLTESEQSRELLKNYVVTIIDGESAHGKTCQKLFDAKSLPHVVVIDKDQKFQLYKASKKLDAKVWTSVLRKYKDGEAPAPKHEVSYRYHSAPVRSYCPNCR
jgi:hypothetical protein